MLRSIKLRVSDRLQANKSWIVIISEPHKGGGVPPCFHEKLFGFAQNPWVALAEGREGSGPPDPPASYAPEYVDRNQ